MTEADRLVDPRGSRLASELGLVESPAVRSCWLLLLMIACSKSEPRSTPAQRTLPPTTAPREEHPAIEKLARDFAAAAKPCDVSKVADLMERQEFMRVVQTHAKEHHGTLLATEVLLSTGAMKICSWMADAADIRFLHVRTAEGQPRAVVRKVGDQGFGHFDVRTIDTPQGPRILDLYSHNNGTWISLEIAETASVPLADNAPGAATILTVNKLENAGKHAEALAILDTLPQATRQSKPIQSLRVAIAGRAGVDAYKQALEERARLFPDNKPTPLVAMNAAFMRGDFTEALAQIDVLDANVGGDPFLDTFRAAITAQRNGPGDLEKASTFAERAVRANPDLAMPLTIKLSVAAARLQWSVALAALDTMKRDFGVVLTEDQLRAIPPVAPLVDTPEYATWRQQQR